MKTVVRTLTLCFMLAIVALALTTPSFAGSQTGFFGTIITSGGGSQFIDVTANLVVNNAGFNTTTLTCMVANCSYTLTWTIENTYATTATLNAFALQMFGNGSNASFDLSGGYSIPANWTAVAGAKINNGNPGLGCNMSGGASGWLCATANAMPNVLSIGSNSTYVMTFSGNFQQGTSIISAFDLMAHGLTNASDDNSRWAVSQGFSWTEYTPPPLPEPGSLAILGSGLFSLGMLLRKKMLL